MKLLSLMLMLSLSWTSLDAYAEDYDYWRFSSKISSDGRKALDEFHELYSALGFPDYSVQWESTHILSVHYSKFTATPEYLIAFDGEKGVVSGFEITSNNLTPFRINLSQNPYQLINAEIAYVDVPQSFLRGLKFAVSRTYLLGPRVDGEEWKIKLLENFSLRSVGPSNKILRVKETSVARGPGWQVSTFLERGGQYLVIDVARVTAFEPSVSVTTTYTEGEDAFANFPLPFGFLSMFTPLDEHKHSVYNSGTSAAKRQVKVALPASDGGSIIDHQVDPLTHNLILTSSQGKTYEMQLVFSKSDPTDKRMEATLVRELQPINVEFFQGTITATELAQECRTALTLQTTAQGKSPVRSLLDWVRSFGKK